MCTNHLLLLSLLRVDCPAPPLLPLPCGCQLQYLSIRYMVGQQAAAVVLSLLAALVPAWERPVMNIVEVRCQDIGQCAQCCGAQLPDLFPFAPAPAPAPGC
jgi:hypothetical protein